MSDKYNLILLGDLDATGRGLSSRTPQLISRLAGRPEIDSVLRIRMPISLPRYTLNGQAGDTRGFSWHIQEIDAKQYRAEWAVPLPYQQADWLCALNAPVLPRLAKKLESAFATLTGRKEYLLWLAHPLLAPALSGLSPALTVFDAIDNFLEHPQFSRLKGTLRRNYEQIAQKADLILTTAEDGPTPWRRTDAPVHHVANGVDVSAFRGPFPEPEALAAIPKPRLGYVGVLQERLDAELTMAMAKRFPEASFVFVGPIFGDPAYFAALQALPNVYFLGPVPYRDVPAYMSHLDVCLLPHCQNAFTASMNPLKLYEYLAAGRPIVSTPVPPAERFTDVIHVAGTVEAFATAIKQALAESQDSEARRRRQTFARSHDWNLRVHEIWRLIQQVARQGLPPTAPASLGHWEW